MPVILSDKLFCILNAAVNHFLETNLPVWANCMGIYYGVFKLTRAVRLLQ